MDTPLQDLWDGVKQSKLKDFPEDIQKMMEFTYFLGAAAAMKAERHLKAPLRAELKTWEAKIDAELKKREGYIPPTIPS